MCIHVFMCIAIGTLQQQQQQFYKSAAVHILMWLWSCLLFDTVLRLLGVQSSLHKGCTRSNIFHLHLTFAPLTITVELTTASKWHFAVFSDLFSPKVMI